MEYLWWLHYFDESIQANNLFATALPNILVTILLPLALINKTSFAGSRVHRSALKIEFLHGMYGGFVFKNGICFWKAYNFRHFCVSSQRGLDKYFLSVPRRSAIQSVCYFDTCSNRLAFCGPWGCLHGFVWFARQLWANMEFTWNNLSTNVSSDRWMRIFIAFI